MLNQPSSTVMKIDTDFPLLQTINSPADLRKLSEDQLLLLARELRTYVLHSLNVCGGHFGANLGTVELTIALHYVFNTPSDYLVWDVGHQAYPHKILTGRRDEITTIRQNAGLAPFPSRNESEYDPFGAGHSSTSISAALGLAIASKLDHNERKAIAVIGDGAMTAGLAFEALNHAGDLEADLIVVLNDNDMSISNNVGALSNYFARLISGQPYTHLREGGKQVLMKTMPGPVRDFVKRTEQQVKDLFAHGKPGSFFEDLGFNYVGPIDGHDLHSVIATLKNVQHLKGPQLLHVVTKKGKGFAPAEADPIGYHAVKKGYFSSSDKIEPRATPFVVKPTYSNIFGQWLTDMAEIDPNLVAITPAMCEGSDLIDFAVRYPDRYFDVGIAEQHAVTVAAGMAAAGKKPVVAIYSTFLQRGYDQLIHDVALQNLPVLFAIDRAGLVGGDGATHNGCFDVSYLRCIPNMMIMTASDENELRQMLYTGHLQSSPVAVRYPRGSGTGVTPDTLMQVLPIGKAEIRRQGKRIAILAFGSMVTPCVAVAEKLNATLINMRFIKPLDETLIQELANTHDYFVTVEENTIVGGAGSAVSEYLAREQILLPVLHLGLPDLFIEHGDPTQLLSEVHLDSSGIEQAITNFQSRLDAKQKQPAYS